MRDIKVAYFGQQLNDDERMCRFKDIRGMRRPGTNRLFCGGKFYQVWFEGGSFIMDRCEVAYNDDDLSDIFSWLGFTIANAGSDDAIHALGQPWQTGYELQFYDCKTLESLGTACITRYTEPGDETAKQVGLHPAEPL